MSPLVKSLLSGKRGKQAALTAYCAAKLGLIPRTDFNYVAADLGVAGSRTAYNRYLSNPSLFTDLELETTVANLRTLTAQQ